MKGEKTVWTPPVSSTHLLPCPLHDLQGDGVDLVVEADGATQAAADLHQQDPEVGPSQVQGQIVPVL